jgi:hypothetical protein
MQRIRRELMAEARLKIDITPQIAAIARPGDTIMLGFDRSLSDSELDQLREDFEGFTDATGVHIAFVEHVTSMVVAQGEVASEDAG